MRHLDIDSLNQGMALMTTQDDEQDVPIVQMVSRSFHMTRERLVEYARLHNIGRNAGGAESRAKDESTDARLLRLSRLSLDRVEEEAIDYIEAHKPVNLIDQFMADGLVDLELRAVQAERQTAMRRFLNFTRSVNDVARKVLKGNAGWNTEPQLFDTQQEIVSELAISVARHIFGSVWNVCQEEVLARLDIKRIQPWTVITLARQFGKTTIVAIFCACLLYYCPNIGLVVVFSVNQNSANRLVTEVKGALEILVGENRNWIVSNSASEISVLQPSARERGLSAGQTTMVNRMKALPSTVTGNPVCFPWRRRTMCFVSVLFCLVASPVALWFRGVV